MSEFFDKAEQLSAWLPSIEAETRIAIDTEADSLHCYFEKLCLIQITATGRDVLIDPLAGFSLEPLFAALTGKELIFHGADYDLRLLRRVGFAGPTRIFDTMIAARLCGVTEFSLAALIESHFGLKLTKASQKANWAKRPLSGEMTDYAVKDTQYLHRLADIFTAQLQGLQRWEWFEQSCEKAIRVTEVLKEKDNPDAWRISGSGTLRGLSAAVLRELWRWRDDEARAADRPAFHVLHNEQLLYAAGRLAQGQPVEFHHLRGSRLRRFQEAAHRAVHLPESEWPVFVRNPRPRPTREDEDRVGVWKKKRDKVAADLSIDPSLIAPRAVLEALVLNPEEGRTRLLPWQAGLLGL
jgi:ribonuclease D